MCPFELITRPLVQLLARKENFRYIWQGLDGELHGFGDQNASFLTNSKEQVHMLAHSILGTVRRLMQGYTLAKCVVHTYKDEQLLQKCGIPTPLFLPPRAQGGLRSEAPEVGRRG